MREWHFWDIVISEILEKQHYCLRYLIFFHIFNLNLPIHMILSSYWDVIFSLPNNLSQHSHYIPFVKPYLSTILSISLLSSIRFLFRIFRSSRKHIVVRVDIFSFDIVYDLYDGTPLPPPNVNFNNVILTTKNIYSYSRFLYPFSTAPPRFHAYNCYETPFSKKFMSPYSLKIFSFVSLLNETPLRNGIHNNKKSYFPNFITSYASGESYIITYRFKFVVYFILSPRNHQRNVILNDMNCIMYKKLHSTNDLSLFIIESSELYYSPKLSKNV